MHARLSTSIHEQTELRDRKFPLAQINTSPANTEQTIRLGARIPVVCASICLVAALVWTYAGVFVSLANRWIVEPDYSHGFLVPVFALYLLWHRRSGFPLNATRGSWWGLVFLAGAGAMRWWAAYFFYPLMDSPSLIPCLAGVTLLIGGWNALRWAWPSICYLVFMMPLPGFLANLLSHPLQRIATISSTWMLQLIGLPAVAQGNVILLPTGQIGVVEACSGLRMLMAFLAITVLASFLLDRPIWERAFISLSAVVIAVVSNICRITLTAILFEFAGEKLATAVFHDMAGWLMMPLALLCLWMELFLLSRILTAPVESMPVHLKP